MTLEGYMLVFENSRDFVDTKDLHMHLPDEAFSKHHRLTDGRFGFYILDEEVYTMLKMSI